MTSEKRLIDANELAFRVSNSTASKAVKAVCTVFITSAPTVDAVEVVRCKDCNNFVPESITVCRHCSLTGMQVVDEDDFCSYGERRTDG